MSSWRIGIGLLFFVFTMSSCGLQKAIKAQPKYALEQPARKQWADTIFTQGNNSLLKNKHGIWEMYVEGNALERGVAIGNLSKELYQNQEHIFFGKIAELVPSRTYQNILLKFLAWFNRKTHMYVSEEMKQEIYGLSRYASEKYKHVGSAYLRALYLHGAHDIGHAMQDLMLVGCSSFAVWGKNSADGKLLVGRNFDFYAGDAFAREKLLYFIRPDKGHPFVSYSWPGMLGVVSGMNTAGISVTINAGKSSIPLIAKTPISLVTRRILQYASSLDEAVAIAKDMEVFVAESIMVSSAKEQAAILIEMAPKTFGVYKKENSSQLVCSNHFQSSAFADDKRNNRHKLESHSMYRFEKMEKELGDKAISPIDAVAILRNTQGIDQNNIGFGNEKSLNQLLAHHGIVFQPDALRVWVSTAPYQLGTFVAYDLNTVFGTPSSIAEPKSYEQASYSIASDPFLLSQEYAKYEAYRIKSREIKTAMSQKKQLNAADFRNLQKLNPYYWEAYYLAGQYYYECGYYRAAEIEFAKAMKLEITTLPQRNKVEKYWKKCKRKQR
ncbi:MAG: C45 family peptidase [Flavobacteriaceae bacterium]|nr:C45 family peptidase [Flavobacteriaceae bacterium]